MSTVNSSFTRIAYEPSRSNHSSSPREELDDAKELDPDAEKEPPVAEAREAIARARRP
ncbi:MAG TPA: hypothetical protein VGY54_23485 [Polyangiaceae bacterium]|jgi:hypothetical protein|nr:hypothetical protein [Polyangiaceae bacterium]